MEWAVTIAIIVVSLGMTGFSAWKSGRPPKDSVRTRWISWPFMTVLGGAILFLAVVHAVNLLGLRTGGGPPQF